MFFTKIKNKKNPEIEFRIVFSLSGLSCLAVSVLATTITTQSLTPVEIKIKMKKLDFYFSKKAADNESQNVLSNSPSKDVNEPCTSFSQDVTAKKITLFDPPYPDMINHLENILDLFPLLISQDLKVAVRFRIPIVISSKRLLIHLGYLCYKWPSTVVVETSHLILKWPSWETPRVSCKKQDLLTFGAPEVATFFRGPCFSSVVSFQCWKFLLVILCLICSRVSKLRNPLGCYYRFLKYGIVRNR